MAQTPDRYPGTRFEEELVLDDRTGFPAPTAEGTMNYRNGGFELVDASGSFDPRTGGDNPINRLMVSSVTGALYTSCVDGVLYTIN
jgi:hypothetical protein